TVGDINHSGIDGLFRLVGGGVNQSHHGFPVNLLIVLVKIAILFLAEELALEFAKQSTFFLNFLAVVRCDVLDFAELDSQLPLRRLITLGEFFQQFLIGDVGGVIVALVVFAIGLRFDTFNGLGLLYQIKVARDSAAD